MLRPDYGLLAFDGDHCHHVGKWQHLKFLQERRNREVGYREGRR